jgi:hypothetical protein
VAVTMKVNPGMVIVAISLWGIPIGGAAWAFTGDWRYMLAGGLFLVFGAISGGLLS